MSDVLLEQSCCPGGNA